MKKRIFYIGSWIIMTLGRTLSFCVGQTALPANLQISEVYFDGTDERVYLVNHSSVEFSGNITLSGASSQQIKVGVQLSGGEGVLLCDQCSMVKQTKKKISGLGLSLSDTIPRSLSIIYESGTILDSFAPGSVVSQLNNKKTSIIKDNGYYTGAQGSGCNEGYNCSLQTIDGSIAEQPNGSSVPFHIKEIYGGDGCIGEYIMVQALADYQGSIDINSIEWSTIDAKSGDILLFSNNKNRSNSFIYGYSGNIVQAKGGNITISTNNQKDQYEYDTIVNGMKKISSGFKLNMDELVDMDESCGSIELHNTNSCGTVDITGNYNDKRLFNATLNQTNCQGLMWYNDDQLLGSGCNVSFNESNNSIDTLLVTGFINGVACSQQILVGTKGFIATGMRSNSIVQSNLINTGCTIIWQQTTPFMAGDNFNVALGINGKTISGTGCVRKRGNDLLSTNCNPRSLVITTGGIQTLFAQGEYNKHLYQCSQTINVPVQNKTINNTTKTISDNSWFDQIKGLLSKRGLTRNNDNQQIEPKKIQSPGSDVGMPQERSQASGDLEITNLLTSPDDTSESETITISHKHPFGENISGLFIVYRLKWYDIGGYWSAEQTKELSRKRSFNNTSGCVYIASHEKLFQKYCWDNAKSKKKNSNKNEEQISQSSKKYENNTGNDYTKIQCSEEINLIKYGYEDYIKELKFKFKNIKQNRIKHKAIKLPNKKKIRKVHSKKISGKSKAEQELMLYKNFVSIIISIIQKLQPIEGNTGKEIIFLISRFKIIKEEIITSKNGKQIYTGNTLQQSFKSYTDPDQLTQLIELLH